MSAEPPVAIPGKAYTRSGVLVVAVSPLALSLRFLQSQPDNRLVALARDGHAPAFEVIVRRYRKELLAYCRGLQPRWGNAEDALQQTLLQAWRALTSGAEVREVRPWLYRIAHNVVVSDLRTPNATAQELEAPSHGPGVDQLVEQRLRARAALDAMASLPTLQRQALVSTTFDGASRAEVAAALGLSRGAVRGLVYRARESLRAAAAAITPSPAVGWALRRAEAATGSPRVSVEALAGGGGAGVAGLLVKGSAVITLAGAVAGTGAALVPGQVHHHARARAAAPHRAGLLADERLADLTARHRGHASGLAGGARSAGGPFAPDKTREGRDSRRNEHGGSGRASATGDNAEHQGSSAGQDGGSSNGDRRSTGGTDGRSGSGVASASGSVDGGPGSSSGDGGSGGSGSPGGSAASSGSGDSGGSGSGADGSNSASTTTSGGQMMATIGTPSDGGSGPGGGTSGGSGSGSGGGTSGDSGSAGTITTSGTH